MDAAAFNLLSETEQLELIWQKSHLLNDVVSGEYQTVYYKIEDFFVMVKYQLATDTIFEIRALEKI